MEGYKNTEKTVEGIEYQDLTFYEKVALNDPSADIRLSATKHITTIAVLDWLAKHDENAKVRLMAVKALPDSWILVTVIFSDEDAEVRKAAALKTSDQGVLMRYLTSANSRKDCLEILPKINEENLETVVRMSRQQEVWGAALFKITDQKVIENLVKDPPNNNSGTFAIGRLDNKTMLEDLALNDSSSKNRTAAVDRIIKLEYPEEETPKEEDKAAEENAAKPGT